MSAVSKPDAVHVDYDTLLYWEMCARVVKRVADELGCSLRVGGMAADVKRTLDISDYARDLADEIHGRVVESVS